MTAGAEGSAGLMNDDELDTAIAVIGMAGRFPGAPDLDAFWRILRDGVDSVRTFSDDELRVAGVPQALIENPSWVKASCWPIPSRGSWARTSISSRRASRTS